MATPRPGARLLIQSAERVCKSRSLIPSPTNRSPPSPTLSPPDRCHKYPSTLQKIEYSSFSKPQKGKNVCQRKALRQFADSMSQSTQAKASLCNTARKQFQVINKSDLMINDNIIVSSDISDPVIPPSVHGITCKNSVTKSFTASASSVLLTEENEKENEELNDNVGRFVQKLGNFTSKILKTKEEIMAAQRLLYDVYIKEQGWEIDAKNPSGLKIERIVDGFLLKDDLEEQAVWFGTLHNECLISCLRLIRQDRSGKLDINRYKDSEKPLLQNILNSSDLVEVQRGAVSQEFRQNGVFALTLSLLVQYANHIGGDIVVATSVESVKRLFSQRDSQIIDENFDYGDGVPTTMFYWPNSAVSECPRKLESHLSKCKAVH